MATLKQFVGKLPTNCLSVFGHFVNLALKGFRYRQLNTPKFLPNVPILIRINTLLSLFSILTD